MLAAHGDELEGLRGLVAELVRRLVRDVIDQREIARFFLDHSLLEDGGISADAGGLVRGRAGHVHGVARNAGEIRLAAVDRNEIPALRGRAVVLAVKRDRVAVGHGAVGKVNDQLGIHHAEDLIAAVAVGNELPLLVGTRVRRPAVQIGLIAVFIQRLAAADIHKLEIAAAVAICLPAAVPLGNARARMAEQLHAAVARRVVAKQVVPVFLRGDVIRAEIGHGPAGDHLGVPRVDVPALAVARRHLFRVGMGIVISLGRNITGILEQHTVVRVVMHRDRKRDRFLCVQCAVGHRVRIAHFGR